MIIIVKRTIVQVIVCVAAVIFYLIAVNTNSFKQIVSLSSKIVADSKHIHLVEDKIFDVTDSVADLIK